MKHRKTYPFGILISPKKDKHGNIAQDPVFELTDNNNNRKSVKLSELYNIIKNQTHAISGYPRYTYIGDGNPRNDRRLVQKKQVKQLDDNVLVPIKFTVVKE